MNAHYEDVALPGLDHLRPVPMPIDNITSGVIYDRSLLPTSDDIARFWDKVVISPKCWFYTGTISTPDGYGRFTFQRGARQRTMSAHRFALLVSGIELGEGMVGEHYCNEPLCVRVDDLHLHASTQQANMAWAVATGRLCGKAPGSGAHISRVERSRRIRQALKNGWDATAFAAAIQSTDSPDQDRLF